MPRPKPNQLHDELDALLDGRPVELTDELAPLAEAADALRAELAAYQLDPQVADRHLERVLHGSATVVPLPVRGQPSGWDLRRRVAAVVLAAALVLAPATMASAAALPGQPMYPFKRAIEELRIASVQWSPSREAVERTRVVDVRVNELDRLVELNMFNQLLPALDALQQAVVEAKEAVNDARAEGEPVLKTEVRLDQVVADGQQVLRQVVVAAARAPVPLTGDTIGAIQNAVRETQDVLEQPGQKPAPGGGAPVTTPTPGSQAGSGSPGSGSSGPTPSQPPPSNSTPEVTTTTGSPVTTTTSPPVTTTTAPEQSTTTESTINPGSAGGGETGTDQAGTDGRTGDDAAPAEEVTTP
ncbi:MAG TPA: hypothetical protein VJ966_03360 [Actinomycetes bacterium]|nr:hypothetical protein [Actinomycetes bacterium]